MCALIDWINDELDDKAWVYGGYLSDAPHLR